MSTDDGNLNKLARKNRLLGPRPDDEEPPEVTIRRGRGDSDAELYDYMRKLWAEQKTKNARLAEVLAALENRVDDLSRALSAKEEIIAVYARCIRDAGRLWHEAHPDTAMYPDGADLIVWLKEQVDKMAERRCETCERAYVAIGRLCCDAVTPDGEWVESDHYCGYYKLKENA